MYHGMNLCYITNNLLISQMVFHFPSKYFKRFSFFFIYFYRFSGCVENCLGDETSSSSCLLCGRMFIFMQRQFSSFLIYYRWQKSLNIPISVEMIQQIICAFFFFIGVKDGSFIIKGFFFLRGRKVSFVYIYGKENICDVYC